MRNPLLSTLLIFGVCSVLSAADEEKKAAKVPFTKLSKVSDFETAGNWMEKEGGVLHLKPRDGEEGWKRYDAYLWFPEQYEDFVCNFEFKLGRGGNSGFYFRISDKVDATAHGFEVQLKDDHGKEDFGPHDVGGVIKTSAPKVNAVKPAGEWNTMMVRLKGNNLFVKLNDQVVQQVNLEKTRPENKPLAKKGWIAIQDHGQEFWVRNIRIKKL
ncbi:MAG: DUF1080 domain-containing protein [Verrucomicrobiota bacterium]